MSAVLSIVFILSLIIITINCCFHLWLFFRFVVAVELIAKRKDVVRDVGTTNRGLQCDSVEVKLPSVGNLPPEVLVPNIGKPPRSRGGFGSKVDEK